MSDKHRKVFIKLPPPVNNSQGKELFVEVDPYKLHLGLLTDFYTWDSRSQKHVPLKGVERIIDTGLSPEAIIERWATIVAMMQPVLASAQDGSSAEFVGGIKQLLHDLPHALEHFAAGRMDEATKAFEAIGFAVLEAVSSAVTSLQRFETQARSHEVLATSMVDIVAQHDERMQERALVFGVNLDEGWKAYEKLAGYELRLNHLFDALVTQSKAWTELSTEEPPRQLRQLFAWLLDIDNGFVTRASRFLISPNAEEAGDLYERINEARQYLSAIDEYLASEIAGHAAAKHDAEELLELGNGVRSLLATMRKGREAVDHESASGAIEYAVVSGVVPNTRVDAWQALLTDPHWHSLHAAEMRLQQTAEAVRSLLDRAPRLHPGLQQKLDNVSRYIERVDAALATFGVVMSPELATGFTNDELMDADESDDDEVDTFDRLSELYEQVVAIGAVKYCESKGRLMGTQLSVILDLLEMLGRLSPEERIAYQLELKELMDEHSFDFEAHGAGRDRMAVWRELDSDQYHWVKFKQGRGRSARKFWHWRLLLHTQQLGITWCQKHGLQPDDIIAVHAERRAASRTRRSQQ